MAIPPEQLRWKTLESKHLFKDTWLTARVDTCQKHNGEVVHPYYVMEYPHWVVALARTKTGKYVIEQQYRHALGEIAYELPGGCIDADDTNFETAIARELLEETGYQFTQYVYLGKTSANPSTNSNWMHMFVALGGEKVQEPNWDANEEINVFEFTAAELDALVAEQSIIQSMHITTYFFAKTYLEKQGLWV
ncbi:MAG: NUDIX hydrolase [Bacteroidetes bacterium]|nr:MAG: NUDIX hydrolase [Bacteroidota bacterium]